jgi:hypothetical protein
MDRPNTAMDVLCWMQTGRDRYLFTVRVYRPGDGRLPVALRTYGYNS